MKTIMEMYMHALHEERENFWDYVEMMKHETNKDKKAVWYAIASDELQHFHKIKSIVWENLEGHTEMEKAFHETMHDEYEKMKKCLEKFK
jgi:rubrerythrin